MAVPCPTKESVGQVGFPEPHPGPAALQPGAPGPSHKCGFCVGEARSGVCPARICPCCPPAVDAARKPTKDIWWQSHPPCRRKGLE